MDYAKRFFAIHLMIRWGYLVPWCGVFLVLFASVGLFIFYSNLVWLIVGLVLATLTFAILRIAVEVIDLIAETLLPR
jgi:hypothetical protein